MPFQTGTVPDAAVLKTTIENFAVANGYTLTGGILSDGGTSNVRLTSYEGDAGTPAIHDTIKIEGSLTADFSLDSCPQWARLYAPQAHWPVTYFLFAHANPLLITCIIQYNVNVHQWLQFGQINLVGGLVGGAYFGASLNAARSDDEVYMALTAGSDSGYRNDPNGAPFWNATNHDHYFGGYDPKRHTFLHLEIDGSPKWPGAGQEYGKYPSFPNYAHPLLDRQPQVLTGEAVLIPYWLWVDRGGGFQSYIGEIVHIRAMRITHFEPGDIVSLGPDRWMVFPWHKKDTTHPNGGRAGYSQGYVPYGTGTLGWAIAYDGP